MDASEFLNFPLAYGKRPSACWKSSVLTDMFEDSPELPTSLQSTVTMIKVLKEQKN